MIKIKVRKALRDYKLDVDIAAGDGETVVLMGSNGSGKTTVLNLAAGLLRPDEGVVTVGARTLFDSANGTDVPPDRRNIGFVFQNYALFPHMTVYDNVAFGLKMRHMPKDEIADIVCSELEFVGLWELRDARASKLSGGQKQRVALARGLAVRPGLLLLDEPLSALDIRASARMRDGLRDRIKKERIPCIVILHNPADAVALGDRVYVLDLGQVVLSGPPESALGTRQ